MLADFPMYDWPEVRQAMDGFWRVLRPCLRARGFKAPDDLLREDDLASLWRSPDLLIGQTCGLPFATDLARHVRLVGTPAYDIGCRPGFYYSVLIGPRRTRGGKGLTRFCGRVAVNDLKSQSGCAALMTSLMGVGVKSDAVKIAVTGSHRASIEAVAEGRAELAAIDAVSFRLGQRHLAAASEVDVIGYTLPTPGLPLITALPAGTESKLADALEEALVLLDPELRDALLLTGLVRTDAHDYAAIAKDWRRVEAWLGLQEAASVVLARISA